MVNRDEGIKGVVIEAQPSWLTVSFPFLVLYVCSKFGANAGIFVSVAEQNSNAL